MSSASMNSLTGRVSSVFSYLSSVACALGVAIALTVLLQPQSPQAGLELRNVQVVKGRPHYYSTKREEYAHVRFDLDADLSSLFHWNTKQLFVYITATYPSKTPATVPPSEAVIWDAIIPASNAPFHQSTYIHPTDDKKQAKNKKKNKQKTGQAFPAGTKPGIIRLAGQRPKYQITDVSGLLAERTNATLTLKWNVQPWVGALVWSNRETIGRWQGLKGGQSKPFDFPPLKGSEVKKEDLKTEKGREGHRLMAGPGTN